MLSKTTDWGTFDSFTQACLQVPVSQHIPRDNTGIDFVWKEGNNAICCFKSDTIASVFRKLSNEKITSMPVLNDATLRFEGFITLLDITAYITSLFYGSSDQEWIDFWSKSDEFKEATVEDCMKKNGEMYKHASTLYYDCSTFTALEILSRPGHYRLCILNSNDRVSNILTQSMIISFIRQNKILLPELMNTKIWDLEETLYKPVHSIEDSALAINAYKKMIAKDVTGLAIVNTNGELTGCISIKDLKGVGANGQNFSRLYQTVKQFKSLTRSEDSRLAPSTHYSTRRVPIKALYVTGTDTFATLIDKMDDGNINRVFVASSVSVSEGKARPVNVITQTDVLKMVLKKMK